VHLIQFFLHNPTKISVGVLLVALFGAIGLMRMPMQLTPEVQTPTITVQTRWPGASPLEVEREIIREQEEFLQSVEGLTKLSSESTDSVGTVSLEFKVGTNMEEALLKVNSRLQQVREYPIDANQPVISAASAADRPIAWFILSTRLPERERIEQFLARHPQRASVLEPVLATDSPGLAELRLRTAARQYPELQELLPTAIDITTLRKFAEDQIEAAFERIEGVSNANVFGGREPELQVIVDPQKLAARQLTIPDVRRVLQQQNRDTSGGDFWESKRRYVVRTLGQFRTPEDVENQILAIHDGAPVLVRDVATVRRGFKKPDGLVRRFGSSTISVNVQRETGANVLDVMQGLREVQQRLNDGPLADEELTLTQVYDETDYIYSAVGLVTWNILFGGTLTVLVLLLFLRSGRSTLVIGLAIPTSIVGTFLMLHLLGRSLNVISLAGLAFAVGMLVDNAVVVLENIYRHYQRGDAPFVAAERGTREVWGAVVASTLTTLAVFLPVLFVEEEAGQLFRDIALAISSAVGLSLIVSVTVIPTASARLFRDRGDRRRPSVDGRRRDDVVAERGWLSFVDRFGSRVVSGVVGLNAWIQRGTLRRLAVVAVLVGVSLGGSYLLWPQVEYLPTGNRNQVFAIVLPPPGYNLNKLMDIGEFIEDQLRPYWDVDTGSPEAQQLPFPAIGDFFYVARGRQIFVGLRASDPTRAGELVPLLYRLGSELPGTMLVANQSSLFERGLGTGRAIDIEITGPDLDSLREIGGAMMGQVLGWNRDRVENGRPPFQARPLPSLDKGNPEAHLIPRLVAGAEVGLSAVDLGYTLNALVDGAYATDFYDDFYGGDKIDLVIMGTDVYTRQTQDLAALPVATPTGELVPIGALAEVRLDAGPEQINHRERQRAITIQVTPPAEVPLEGVIDRIHAEILAPMRASGQLPAEYLVNLSGTADKLLDTWLALRWNILLALLITYLLMAALFESWVYPLVIILSVPLGAVGGVLGFRALSAYLVLRGQAPQTLDVLTMLGFIILIGTVVNNAILIVHQSLNHMRNEGWGPRESILESVRTRIRPIAMTTATTVFGLMPLVLFPGAGSELYRGLGSVVLGGLLVSTIFTLFLVPTLFSLFMDAFGREEHPIASESPDAPEEVFAGDGSREPLAVARVDRKH
jgi:hydrophobic/amphiphilic exporter-1 (mainly G- bacteria), HAE1 family